MVDRRKKLLMMGGGQYVTLPQNLLISPGTLFEDFETAADWTATTGSCAANTTAGEFYTGAQSMKLTAAVGSYGRMTKTISQIMSTWNRWRIHIYNHEVIAQTSFLHIHVSSSTTYTKYMYMTLAKPALIFPGMNQFDFTQDQFQNYNTEAWANTMVRMRMVSNAVATYTPSQSWDSLYTGIVGQPAIVLHFDDGYPSQYTTCLPYMRAHGIRGTLNLKTDMASGISAPQVTEMYTAGWDVVNHTRTHPDLTTLSEADQETELTNGYNDLIAGGWPRAAKHVSYPGGTWNADTKTAMAALGNLTGRATTGYTVRQSYLPAYDMFAVEAQSGAGAFTLAVLEGYIDLAILRGGIIPLIFHDVGGAGELTAAEFRLLIDYIVARKNQIIPITISDYYNLTIGPVRVPRIY